MNCNWYYCVVLDAVLSQMIASSQSVDDDLDDRRSASVGKRSFRSVSPVDYGIDPVEKAEKLSSVVQFVAGSPESKR